MRTIHAREGLRMFSRSLKTRISGTRKYKGNARQICSRIVKECFNRSYFQASRGHFCQFYARDFGWCAGSLIKLGYRQEVIETLEYALGIFSRNSTISSAISPSGKLFDFPSYSPDSLPYIMKCIGLAGAKGLAEKHKSLLNTEIKRFFENAIDKGTGLVRKDRHFSSIKDHALRKSSCYDNIMAAVLAEELKKFRFLDNPLKDYGYKKIIRNNFWNGEYFIDDLSGKSYVAGDSNVFPFWTGIFSSKKMLKSAVESVQNEGLDKPFPLRYTKSRKSGKRMLLPDFLARNYEGNTVWTHMGPLYISLLKRIDKAKFDYHVRQYKRIIEKHRNYIELFNPDRTIFRTPFYCADESMLWAANFLAL